jgi:beta-phosphoglucomutase
MEIIKGIIFDLDGVIVSTDEFHYQAWKHLADDLGIYFDKEINHRLRGISRMESLNVVLERSLITFTDDYKIKLAERKNEMYLKLLRSVSKNQILPGIIDLLFYLKKKNIPLAIGSSSKNARFILDKIELSHAFDAIVDGNDITKSKPDPEVFTKASQRLGIPSCNCLVIEDAISGVESGNRAGCQTVYFGDNDNLCDSTYKAPDGYSLYKMIRDHSIKVDL